MSLLDHFNPKPRKPLSQQTLDDLSSEEDEEPDEDFDRFESSESDEEVEPKPRKKTRLRSYTNGEKAQVVKWLEAENRSIRGAVKEFCIPRRNIRSEYENLGERSFSHSLRTFFFSFHKQSFSQCQTFLSGWLANFFSHFFAMLAPPFFKEV